ncbi:MAG: GntR family transcriptional regulator [Thermodesulfobacteriota bacterium]
MPSLLKERIQPRRPLGDEVYQAIKSAIIKGDLEPGQRLIEEKLAEDLGASRTPVRQAVHMLERENLVERQKRGGFVVRGLSLEDIEEILDLRAVLESFAARSAAEKITAEALALLERRNETFGQALREGRKDKLPKLNTEFHESLYSLCGNRRLQRMIQDLYDHFYRYRLRILSVHEMARTSYDDHKEMIAAMSDGDPDLTERLVRAHILKGKDVMVREVKAGRMRL